jgi:hypothetical protein
VGIYSIPQRSLNGALKTADRTSFFYFVPDSSLFVILPPKVFGADDEAWIPAFAGMTNRMGARRDVETPRWGVSGTGLLSRPFL